MTVFVAARLTVATEAVVNGRRVYSVTIPTAAAKALYAFGEAALPGREPSGECAT